MNWHIRETSYPRIGMSMNCLVCEVLCRIVCQRIGMSAKSPITGKQQGNPLSGSPKLTQQRYINRVVQVLSY